MLWPSTLIESTRQRFPASIEPAPQQEPFSRGQAIIHTRWETGRTERERSAIDKQSASEIAAEIASIGAACWRYRMPRVSAPSKHIPLCSTDFFNAPTRCFQSGINMLGSGIGFVHRVLLLKKKLFDHVGMCAETCNTGVTNQTPLNQPQLHVDHLIEEAPHPLAGVARLW